MIVNDAGEAWFKIAIIGKHDPLALLRDLHEHAKAELRGELTINDDPQWTIATFDLSFAGLQSQGHPVRAHLIAHKGPGLLSAQSADLKTAFEGTDALIVRAGSDPTDDMNASATLLTSAALGAGVYVVLEAPGAAAELAQEATGRYAPRHSHVLTEESKALDVLKHAVKGMLAYQARKSMPPPA